MQGVYFPKPAEILQLVADDREQRITEERRCSVECQSQHGKGYDWHDVFWLLKRRLAAGKDKWTQLQWDTLMVELDAKREGGAPAWRANG